MNLRLKKAELVHFGDFQKYYQNILYHWFLGDNTAEERKKILLKPRPPRKPNYDREGKEMPNSTKKYLAFDQNDYATLLEQLPANLEQIYIIYDGKSVIGFLKCKIECEKLRIIEFPLDFDYQNKEVICQIVSILQKKRKKKISITTIIGSFAEKLLEGSGVYLVVQHRTV